MRRLLFLLILLFIWLLCQPARAQTPPVGRVDSDPSGRACTAEYPILYRNTGATVLWYFCNSSNVYQVVGTGVGRHASYRVRRQQ